MNDFRIAAALALAISISALAGSTPLGSAFTYQGHLKQAGNPITGTADLQFSLWDSASGGLQMAGPLAVNNVAITQGNFVASLDFGATVFDGGARWLQIAVRSPAGGGAFTTLSTRQPLTATPYALQTRGLFVDSDGDLGIGTTTPAARLHVAGSARLSGAAPYAFSMYNGAGQILDIAIAGAPGEYSLSALTNDVVIRNVAVGKSVHFQTGIGNAAMTIRNNNTISMGGATSQAGTLNVLGDNDGIRATGFWTGIAANATHDNAAAGVLGYATAGTSYGVLGETSSTTGTGVRGVASMSSGISYGVNGRCNSPNGFDFYATGAGTDYGSSSSIRWKRNIEPIADPLAMLAQIRGVYYDWDTAHGGQHDIGMIAEEVGEVLPEIVNYEENGVDAIAIDYSKLTPLLVEAVKALKRDQEQALAKMSAEKDAQIAALRSANDDLRRELDAIRKQVRNIENRP